MKCVTVLSNSASDFGYCEVSLLPVLKPPSITLIDDFLFLLFVCYLNCSNNPAKSVRNFNVFPLCLAQSPYLSLISVERSFFADWEMRLLLPDVNFECRISDQQQNPHNSLLGFL